jgi:hypothetical protein
MSESVMSPLSDAARALSGGIDAVVTHHRDGFRSGVARFNELLATRLGVALHDLYDRSLVSLSCPLLSFKAVELPARDRERLARNLESMPWQGIIFLHTYDDLPIERLLLRRARRVLCGNHEIFTRVREFHSDAELLWSPGLILEERTFMPVDVSVFSFGMAHKIRADMFGLLRDLLDDAGFSYSVYVSAANHETAMMRDAEDVWHEMQNIFSPERLYFLGNLSDVAVYNYLRQSTFFASFFIGGVRANNGTVAAAMEKGAVVLTNFDEFSPPEFRHMDNIVDIARCDELPLDPRVLRRISARALETARERGWDALVRRIAGQ